MKIDVLKMILNEVDVPTSKLTIGLTNSKEFKFNEYYLDLIQDKLIIIQDINQFETYYYFDIEEIVYIKNSAYVSPNEKQSYSESIEKKRAKYKND